MSRVGIYPGTFDPVTNGHLDLIERGRRHVDRLVLGVLGNEDKRPVFTVEERTEFLKRATARIEGVEVDSFDGLLVDYARRVGASLILRGLRAVSDFEYELQMAMMNRRLAPEVETVFLMPSETYSYVSSRLVREVARLGGDIAGLVPESIESAVRKKLAGGGSTGR